MLLAALAFIAPNEFKLELVISDSKIASEVGAQILRNGGNAVDAAVATGFALAVTFPAAGNIGGGGFMLVRMANGKTAALDFREIAPKAASRDMYLDASGKVVPNSSLVGYRASGVPGTVAGLWEAHRRFGKLPWKSLVEPARQLAADGFEVSPGFARSLRSSYRLLGKFPESKHVFCRDGDFYTAGQRLIQSDLASTLTRVRDHGSDGFYKGETAELIDKDMAANGGLVTKTDLAAYKVEVRKPLVGSYRAHQVITMPPPSSGGVALIEMLNILSGGDFGALPFGSGARDHLLVETMKRAFADRSEYMGDPAFTKVPVAELTDPAYGSRLRASITDRATPSAEIKPGLAQIPEGNHTTHYTVVDKDGNAVATTYTLNTGFGSGEAVVGAGFLMNNEMDDFAAKVGVPNGFGLIQGEANTIAPGKRPLSSMVPTIVLKDGKLFLALGSPGGPTIINTVLQTVLNVIDLKMSVQEAVAAPRIHHQWLPDQIQWESGGISADVRAELEAKGHHFAGRGGYMGSCHAILVDEATGERMAGVDPRSGDAGAAGQ